MPKRWIPLAMLGLISALAIGCTTTEKADILPQDGPTLHALYDTHFDTLRQRQAYSVREHLGVRPAADPFPGIQHVNPSPRESDPMDYTRHSANEILGLFPRLPNPDLVMYVFPHLAGPESVPVPGYATTFPMYERVEYALPGEVPGR